MDARKQDIRRKLLRWFDEHRSPMPWRNDPSPYRVWISEIMLQQTRVATVIPYYEQFMQRFPDLPSLAEAGEEELLSLWSGLGYYSRARNLHRAAKILIREHGGNFPCETRLLRTLPGIGEYTAGALASIAFGLPEVSIDGNQVRVLTRLEALGGDPTRKPLAAQLRELAGEWVKGERPGDWNQAVMEFGARVCKPQNPQCGDCLLSEHCLALTEKRVGEIPELPSREPPVPIEVQVGVFEEGGELLLCRLKRPFLSGMWNLPWRVRRGAGLLAEEEWGDLGLRVREEREVAETKTTITRYRILQKRVEGRAELPPGDEYRYFSPEELKSIGLPAFSRKILNLSTGT
ncbi:MAG: A/G-specific adenine glycosylase [Candidatus Krumholzibacteria bacterium]|jgi:A/G-specific adenine glycosylase|nr:A/G-specific adenine glycosylase [Candidatus Krumholzibacteria bacterium]MDP6668312.1 A/G-specific adenine glycosylase [Candidatus Krumholzibacteria bacterium]MDP6797679.1 A/G-specific adenine glycosylase [Candidatus Krumholzibacteria bacterium]MDP7022116.1 A/G-specific adenine glycosylase [Candidatus Krumholzibacteria bacterium]